MDDGRYAEPGLLEQVALDLVGESGRFPGCQVAGARDPGDVPEALPEQWPGLVPGELPLFGQLEDPGAPQLGDLLLESHHLQQALDALVHGEAGVAVGRLLPVDGDRSHPFTPPVVSPVTICFWAMK